jgi:hypothetical protein
MSTSLVLGISAFKKSPTLKNSHHHRSRWRRRHFNSITIDSIRTAPGYRSRQGDDALDPGETKCRIQMSKRSAETKRPSPWRLKETNANGVPRLAKLTDFTAAVAFILIYLKRYGIQEAISKYENTQVIHTIDRPKLYSFCGLEPAATVA